MDKDGRQLNKQEKDDIKDVQTEPVAPDGGWSWVVLFAAFLNVLLSTIHFCSYGILYAPVYEKEGTTSTYISGIFSLHSFIYNSLGMFMGPLCAEFGCRKVAIFGGLSNSLSLLLSAFTPSSGFLFFAFSLLGGIGMCTGLTVSFIIVSKYFDKRRGFAMSIVASGNCWSLFIGPPLTKILQTTYGYTGGTCILGAIILNTCAASALFQPVERHMKKIIPEDQGETKSLINSVETNSIKERNEIAMKKRPNRTSSIISECTLYSIGSAMQSIIQEPEQNSTTNNYFTPIKGTICSIFNTLFAVCKSTVRNFLYMRQLRVLTITFASGIMFMGYVYFQMWIPFAMANIGFSHEKAAFVMSVSAISNFVTRIFISFLMDMKRFDKRLAYIAGNLMVAASIMAYTFCEEIIGIIVTTCLWGSSIGWVMSLYTLVMIETMGVDLFPATYGLASLFVAVFFLLIGPLLGLLRDATDDYGICLRFIAGFNTISAILWILMPFAETFDKRKDIHAMQGENA